MTKVQRVFLLVLDSVGLGGAKDAAIFSDEGANTLGHIAEYCENNNISYRLPNMAKLGLSTLMGSHKAYSLPVSEKVIGSAAVMSELSLGKDTTTGHWEIAGTPLPKAFDTYPDGFPVEMLSQWCAVNSLSGYLCNSVASGTQVIEDFGADHLQSHKPIAYTSVDSVMQVACHEALYTPHKLYELCQSARSLLDQRGMNVARVIARPFDGEPGSFRRTQNRKDFSLAPPIPNLFDILVESSVTTVGVGKIKDIFAHRSVTESFPAPDNKGTIEAIKSLMLDPERKDKNLFCFANLIDFDQLFGHRRDVKGYAKCLEEFDAELGVILTKMQSSDLLIICADHGNDPTYAGTDHTRERVPLLVYSPHPQFNGGLSLGDLDGFTVVSRLILDAFSLSPKLSQLPAAADTKPLAQQLGIN